MKRFVLAMLLVTLAATPLALGGGDSVVTRYAGDLGLDLGRYDGPGLDGMIRATAVDPGKLKLCGLPALEKGVKVDLQVQSSGRVILRNNRLSREHILLSVEKGGWWPFLLADMGVALDGTKLAMDVGRVGSSFNVNYTRRAPGTIRDPRKLALLGVKDVTSGMRVEVVAAPDLAAAGLPAEFRAMKAPAGSWGLLLLEVKGEASLGKTKLGTKHADFPAAARAFAAVGLGLESPAAEKLKAIGHLDHGKSTLLARVTDSAKLLTALGEWFDKGYIKEVKRDALAKLIDRDHVHVMMSCGKDGWRGLKLALCSVSPKHPKAIAVRLETDGKLKRSDAAGKGK